MIELEQQVSTGVLVRCGYKPDLECTVKPRDLQVHHYFKRATGLVQTKELSNTQVDADRIRE